ncbi:P-loop containing nucleoside triphosphate hydrolase protein, partial [Mucor lusitanicus]
MNILFKLREFYGDLTASFKSVDQARAMAMVLKRESDVLAVLATGQGKSLLFFLAAFIEKQQGRTTVVVSPLVALMADMKARCNMHGLTYDTWREISVLILTTLCITTDARSTLTRVDILFVAVEHCSNIDLLCHLRALSQHGDRLARIVFDEAHLAITWNDWRPEMHNLHTLRTQRVPILLLTATLPPKLEQELKIAFGSNFTTVRQASTTRPELQYKVTKKEKTSEMREELFSAIEALITDNNGHAAIIIFFLETRTAERFQEEIQETRSSTQVLVYHGQMTPEARTANQTAFMRETDGVMIMCCTSAFAMGVDKADINAVIHYGICDFIMEYVQGAGRAKRNPDAFIAPGQCIL